MSGHKRAFTPVIKMSNRRWTAEEKEYLCDHWGAVSTKGIAQRLGRSENAILIKVSRFGLGPFLESGDYITFNQLLSALGVPSSSYKKISWIENRGFPIKNKKVNANNFKVVELVAFWKWAKKNQSFLNFSKFEENILGEEPYWVKEKRRRDLEMCRKFKSTPWTKTEDEQLLNLLRQQKYSYDELSKKLQRTCGAIQRRAVALGYKERPVKADGHNKWNAEEVEELETMICKGVGYEHMAERLGRSSKAIRGFVYRKYNTERLDTARERVRQ